jgi:glutamyl-tRNA reductase
MRASKTVAIAGAGDVAKYLVEELLKEGRHKIVVLSRAVRGGPPVSLCSTLFTRCLFLPSTR